MSPQPRYRLEAGGSRSRLQGDVDFLGMRQSVRGRALTCADNAIYAIAASLRHLPDMRGKGAVAMSLKRLRERRRPLDGSWTIRTYDGCSVSLPRGSTMGWQVAATGYWDRHVISLVSEYIAEGTIVLDVGASLGLWTLPLGRVVKREMADYGVLSPIPTMPSG